ncbi:E3 ubiquitin-protein ligase RING1-like [Senna tora]|uniref:E3 ubiquitin-protein ligase RING1-like n=1 Tax=Senna tora TaxID=362788 RepID=A0A834T398_9FABA|nr:E3 ubiquitin-protein ligase RING1-like [Senna tora]
MLSPEEISRIEDDLLEHSFDIRFNLTESTRRNNLHTNKTVSLFESPFIMSCQELLQDVPRFLGRALSSNLCDEEINLLAAQVASHARSLFQYYCPDSNSPQITRRYRLVPLSVDIQVIYDHFDDEQEEEGEEEDGEIVVSRHNEFMVPASRNALGLLKKVVRVIKEQCSICLEDFDRKDKDVWVVGSGLQSVGVVGDASFGGAAMEVGVRMRERWRWRSRLRSVALGGGETAMQVLVGASMEVGD